MSAGSTDPVQLCGVRPEANKAVPRREVEMRAHVIGLPTGLAEGHRQRKAGGDGWRGAVAYGPRATGEGRDTAATELYKAGAALART